MKSAAIEQPVMQTGAARHSAQARRRMETAGERPIFYCDWMRALFIHFECDPDQLQRETPFPLHLRDGRAYVSLVAFTMERLRPVFGGRYAAACLKPIARHEFLNVRTYVQLRDEPGIFFLIEWLPNRLSVLLGPPVYGLPYNFGRFRYEHNFDARSIRGEVSGVCGRRFTYSATLEAHDSLAPCEAGTLDEFLLERYTAYTRRGASSLRFRIWHRPWPQVSARVELGDTSLLMQHCPWFASARCVGANYSTGAVDVWVGAPKYV